MKKDIKTFVNIDKIITHKDALNLTSTFDSADNKACICKIQEKKEEKFAKAAFLTFPYRNCKECFQYEVTEFGKMCHSKESDSLNKFRQIQGAVVELMKSNKSEIVFDLSVVINTLAKRKSIKPKTISEFYYKNAYEEISKQSKGCARIDIVTDSNPDGINLKEISISQGHYNACGIREQYSISNQLCQ